MTKLWHVAPGVSSWNGLRRSCARPGQVFSRQVGRDSRERFPREATPRFVVSFVFRNRSQRSWATRQGFVM